MTAVEPEWLAELGPMFFSIKETHTSRLEQRQKVGGRSGCACWWMVAALMVAAALAAVCCLALHGMAWQGTAQGCS